MMSFQSFLSMTMAEQFQKYKDILDREKEEFKKQLEREVSTFLILFEWIKEGKCLNLDGVRTFVVNFKNINGCHLCFWNFEIYNLLPHNLLSTICFLECYYRD